MIRKHHWVAVGAAILVAAPALAAPASAPKAPAPKPPANILPQLDPELPPLAPPPATQAPMPTPAIPVPPPAPVIVIQDWSLEDARALVSVIDRIGERGLFAKDYEPDALRAAIAAGPGAALNELATRQFTRLAVDLRDGRTPQAGRVQWLIKDDDYKTAPIDQLLSRAVTQHDVAGVLAALDPAHPDFQALKAALATATPDQRKVIRANMDRWRWMPRTLGSKFLFANVPEYLLRVTTFGRTVATYPVIVGKPTTPTPQLNAMAKGVVVHPPWYLPKSVIAEGVGAMIARSPAAARAKGYTWTGSGNTLAVIQKAGPNSALGVIKVDMPNSQSIFIHDTPSRHLFGAANQALSHGCLRTERAMELGILLGILQKGGTAEELAELIKKGKTERVAFQEELPVYIGYFTMGLAQDGALRSYKDLYGRDVAIMASFDQPRAEKPIAPVPPVTDKPDQSEKPVSEQKPTGA